MLIALLAVLGVDLGVIIVIVLAVLARRRWVSRQPGAFRGAIRVTEGEVPGLSGRWRRGYGHWDVEADGRARIAISVASNGGKALGPFAAARGKTSMAE